jgi:hypothetical protein
VGPAPKPATDENAAPADDAGAQGTQTDVPAAPPSSIPPPVTPSFARPTNEWDQTNREPVDDEWKMSDLGPPPRNKRRKWLWVIVAILAFFVLACCGFLFWISATDAGSTWFNDLATQVSEQATEAAQ